MRLRSGAGDRRNYYRIPITILVVLLNLAASPCSNAQQSKPENNILIVYLSRTKNTKAVAEMIQKFTGGELVELEVENPYPDDYQTTVNQVEAENESGFLPALKTKVNIEKYNTVFIGFPTWGMQLPPPMKSFLNRFDLSGKTVIPFNTHAGFGVGSGFDTVKELCPNSKILEGLSMEGGYEKKGVYLAVKGEKEAEAEKEVESWLKKIAILN